MIYKNINIWVGTYGFATPQNIKNATITFRVTRSWISENRIDPASITLMHYSSGWNALPAEKIDENAAELYYEARTDSFKHFAITGKRSGIQGYSQVYSTAPGSGSMRKEENTIKSNETTTDESENPSGLTIFLLVGMLVGGIVNAALVLKVGKLR